MFGFDTQCGRDAWVKFAVDTITKGDLDGVFIDGFQGCHPSAPGFAGSCPGAVSTCSAAQAKAWLDGMAVALISLRADRKSVV